MNRRFVFCVLAAGVALAGCKSGSPEARIDGKNLFVTRSALTAFFPHDVTLTEATANTLRTIDPRYTIQKVAWSFKSDPGTVYRSNPLAHANVDYAHAAGLTGAGQTIAFVDEGYLTTHQELTGKTITMPAGIYAPGIDDHGTATTSIAAGTGAVGDMIGVAPGADLQLGSFNSFESMTAATKQAMSVGAIVQNNSWGYDITFSQSNYERVFGSPEGKAYISSLRDLAKGSVIVFSASNIEGNTKADLMSALPSALPELEKSWITVINAVPTFKGSKIKGGKLVSAKCLDAAAWCMAADGTWTAATGTGNADYDFVTGTSMAAPMVSGAVALLAEAFPSLNGKELRARLMASANNSFYKHTGFVAFAPGIKHGYNETYGHGFLDLKAALLPIGGSFMPVTRGKRVRVDQPILRTGGMAGNALSRRLADHDIMVVDGMGAGFDMPASILTSEAVESTSRETVLALMDGSADEAMARAFPSYMAGRQLDLQLGETRVALLVPAGGSAENYGISLQRRVSDDLPGVSLGLTAMQESESYIGMQSMLSGTRIGGAHLAATLGLDMPFSDRHGLRLTGTVGIAQPQGSIPSMDMSSANFNAVGMSYGAKDFLASGDRFTLGLSLPQVVHSGVAKVALPSTRSIGGATQFNSFDVPLTPDARQMDLTFSYSVPVSRNAGLTFSAVRSLNESHISGRSASGAGIGFQFQF
jgi:hypothetical protein